MDFYVHKNGEQIGPIDASELQRQFEAGLFSEDDLVWNQEQNDWKPLGSFLSRARQIPNQIAGAASFKDWWFTVWVRTPAVIMPARCSCCMRTDGLRQRKVAVDFGGERQAIEHPICSSCSKHAGVDSIAIAIAVVAGAIIPPFVYYSLFGLKFLRGAWELTLLVYLICGALVAGVFYFPIYRFCPWKGLDCADGGWPVDIEPEASEEPLLGKKNERTDEREYRLLSLRMQQGTAKDCIALRFTNRQYLAEFIALNGGDPSQIVTIEAKF